MKRYQVPGQVIVECALMVAIAAPVRYNRDAVAREAGITAAAHSHSYSAATAIRSPGRGQHETRAKNVGDREPGCIRDLCRRFARKCIQSARSASSRPGRNTPGLSQ